MIKVKRIYEQPEPEDGFRILVDRLWPRGLSKTQARVDLWLRDIAPSDRLRKWFAHDPKKWEKFKQRYRRELGGKKELVRRVRQAEKQSRTLTLLVAAKDEKRNNAVALKEALRKS